MAKETINAAEIVHKLESLQGEEKKAYGRKLTMEQRKAAIEYVRDRDTQMVRGTFRCYEPVGGSIVLTAKPFEGCEYQYTLEDGKEYSLPLFLAKRLNSEYQGLGTWYPTHKHAIDSVTGKPRYDIMKKNFRFSMTSSDFVGVNA